MAGYGSDSGFADYVLAAGYTVPDGTVAPARQRGSAYIDAVYGMRFPGRPTGGVDQEREWPRIGAADVYGNAIAADAVPWRVINASYEAALLELQTPGSLAAVLAANERVKSLKAGSVAIEYAEGSTLGAAGAVPLSTRIEGILAPLLVPAYLPAVLVV